MSEEKDVMQEVVEPENSESEEPEVAEPESVEEEEIEEPHSKRTADEAFADMRRTNKKQAEKIEELESQLAKMEKSAATKDEALGYYFEGEDKELQAIAEATGVSYELLKEARAEEEEHENAISERDKRIAELEADNAAYESAETERLMKRDLAEIQKLNPDIKSLDELPDVYFDLMSTGLVDGVTAYKAVMASGEEPPTPPGRAKVGGGEQQIFTKAEVEAMSREEISKNMKAIDQSMKYW